MGQFITYAEIDSDIQKKMPGSAPGISTRLQAINNAIQDLYTDFDIESSKRGVNFSMVFDGLPVKLTDFISDYKHAKDLRFLGDNNHKDEFSFIDEDLLEIHKGQGMKINEYSISWMDGNLYIKAITEKSQIYQVLHGMSSLTGDGTWAEDTTDSDASNLSVNEVLSLNQSGALSFDIDVSQSVNNYALIENSTLTSIDISDYLNFGKFRFRIKLPSVTEFTSITLRWGSSSSAYYEATATVQSNGSALVAGWNHININWSDATTTGSPDSTAIDYLAVKLNYTASFTDQVNIIIEALTLYLPFTMTFDYYTYFSSQTTGGSFQADLTTTSTDELLIPRRYKSLIVAASLIELIPIAYGDDAQARLTLAFTKYNQIKKNLGMDVGEKIKTEKRKAKIRGW